MAKRRKNNDGGVSLFPFMSILACLIGILTLMISVSMKAKEIDQEGRTEEEMARAVANRDMKKKAKTLTKEIKKLSERLKKEKSTAAEMAKLEEHKIVLRTKFDEIQKAKDPMETDAELQKKLENLKQEISQLKRERPPLAKQLAALQEELKKRKEPPKVVESVVIRPGGIGSREARNLFFIECTSTGIVLHSDDSPSKLISTATIETNEDFNNLLEKVKRTRDSMVLFLIRKGGNTAYQWAAGTAETKYKINTGKLPIPNEGIIDLSLFK
jgi:chaperonin cofactor prefoldin